MNKAARTRGSRRVRVPLNMPLNVPLNVVVNVVVNVGAWGSGAHASHACVTFFCAYRL